MEGNMDTKLVYEEMQRTLKGITRIVNENFAGFRMDEKQTEKRIIEMYNILIDYTNKIGRMHDKEKWTEIPNTTSLE